MSTEANMLFFETINNRVKNIATMENAKYFPNNFLRLFEKYLKLN